MSTSQNIRIGTFIFCFFMLVSLIEPGEVTEIRQKDWLEYFPNIEKHLSVYEPEFETVDMSYESPHTKWAKPYYLGKIKTLIIAPRVCHRDSVELAQRLDMQFDTFCSYNMKQLGGADPSERRSRTHAGFTNKEQLIRLNKLLNKKYDVIIIGQMFWNAFPKDVQDKILSSVKDGIGLVISFSGGNETNFVPSVLRESVSTEQAHDSWIARGIPFTALSSWKHFKSDQDAIDKIISLKEFGRGKVVILNVGGNSRNAFFVPSPPSKPEIKLWQLDYYFSLAAKAVLWASGKSPENNLECLIKKDLVEIKGSGSEKSGKSPNFSLMVRNSFGNVVYEKESKKDIFKLPELPAGGYIADIILKRKGKSINWYSTSFEIKREPSIQLVDVNPKTIEPGSKSILKTVLSSKTKKGFYLQIRLIDIFGRLLCDIKERVAPNQNTVNTEFVLKRPLSNLVKADVTLYDRNHELSHSETWIPVRLPYPRDDFGFIAWNLDSNEYVWHYARRELYKLGVDTSYGGKSWIEAWAAASGGIYVIPYITRYAINKTTEKPCHVRTPCLSDPEYIEREQKKLKRRVKETVLFAPPAYSLGDENNLSLNDVEVCFAKSCKESFSKYARSIYKNLDVLNMEWNTSYTSWENIEPIPLEEARKLNQPARWVDFRMHMENVFLDIHKIGKETIRSIDPNALVGFDGGFNTTSFTGYDWWKLSKILDLWGIYPDHLQSEILRSFHKKEARTGRWYGGYNHITRFVEYAHWEPWYDLFHEMNNIWWFNIIEEARGMCHAEDAMNPASFKPFPILKASSEETLEIKRGIGKLLLGCRRDSGGIAILYSQPSLHASTYYSKYGNPNESQYDFIRILEDMNYQYRFISYEQLKEGILKKENYKLLILPCSIALSDEEKKQIRSFVNSEGKVIADTEPGIFDEHGNPAKNIECEKFLRENINVIGSAIKGYRKNNSRASGMRKFFSNKLKNVGIESEFSVIPDIGEIYEGELAVFTDENIRYVGLLRDHSVITKGQKARIKLPHKAHVYNIRTREYLGYVDEINANIEPGMAGLWGMLPEKASGLKLQIKPVAGVGEHVSYSIFTEPKISQRHVVRVEVSAPDGVMQKHYCRNLTLNRHETEGIIPLALNDKRGLWKIKVWNVVSGVSDSKKFMVR